MEKQQRAWRSVYTSIQPTKHKHASKTANSDACKASKNPGQATLVAPPAQQHSPSSHAKLAQPLAPRSGAISGPGSTRAHIAGRLRHTSSIHETVIPCQSSLAPAPQTASRLPAQQQQQPADEPASRPLTTAGVACSSSTGPNAGGINSSSGNVASLNSSRSSSAGGAGCRKQQNSPPQPQQKQAVSQPLSPYLAAAFPLTARCGSSPWPAMCTH